MEMPPEHETIQLVGIEQQGADAGQCGPTRRDLRSDVLFESSREPECRALAGDARDSDPPAHHVDQLFRDRESQPRSPESARSEEHTSELQSRVELVCRLMLEKKKELVVSPGCGISITCMNYVASRPSG